MQDGHPLTRTVKNSNEQHIARFADPRRNTKSNETVQREHTTPRARDEAGVTPGFSGETSASVGGVDSNDDFVAIALPGNPGRQHNLEEKEST